MEISHTKILDQIHFARFGVHLSENEDPLFFNELCAYQRALIRAGRTTVSIPAIRSWLRKEGRPAVPKRAEAMSFLRGYVQWIISNSFAAEEDRKPLLFAIEHYLSRYDRFAASAHAQASTVRSRGIDPIIALTLQGLFTVSDQNPRLITNDLFRDGDSSDPNDLSFFLMYRYSTNHGSVLKTFIVFQKPDPNLMNYYGFNHFIWGGEGQEFQSHIYRECEGVILKLEKGYYFLGYNFTVPTNKRHNPAEYERLRGPSKQQPNGMGLIAVEYDEVNLRPGLFGGVTMTLGAAHQPVVARVAFLHLGTRSSLGVPLSDHVVQPTELYPRQIAGDLRDLVNRLKKIGCQTFGSHLHQLMALRSWDKSGASNLALEICRMIDNTPAWERGRSRAKGGPNSAAHGAIETFGLLEGSRPRE